MAHVQRSSIVAGNGGTPNRAALTLTGTVAGNDIIVTCVQTVSNTRTYSAADGVNGSYSVVKAYTSSSTRVITILRYKNGAGGNLTINVDSSGSGSFVAVADEVAGLDQSASPVTSDFIDPVAAGTHPCAQSGEIDTSGAAFVVSGTALSGAATGGTAASGWTSGALDASNFGFVQYYDAAGALTDERGTWTQTGTTRVGSSAIAAFPYAAESDPSSYVTGGWFGR